MIEFATIPMKQRTVEERTCNHCGKCCQDILLHVSPEEMEHIRKGEHPRYNGNEGNEKVAQMVIYVKTEEVRFLDKVITGQKYHYKCTNYIQRPDGKGECGIYETRPTMCRIFPFSEHWGGTTEEQHREHLEKNPFVAPYEGCSYNATDEKPYWDKQ
jgi:Fe-S-cluster containining protein